MHLSWRSWATREILNQIMKTLNKHNNQSGEAVLVGLGVGAILGIVVAVGIPVALPTWFYRNVIDTPRHREEKFQRIEELRRQLWEEREGNVRPARRVFVIQGNEGDEHDDVVMWRMQRRELTQEPSTVDNSGITN